MILFDERTLPQRKGKHDAQPTISVYRDGRFVLNKHLVDHTCLEKFDRVSFALSDDNALWMQKDDNGFFLWKHAKGTLHLRHIAMTIILRKRFQTGDKDTLKFVLASDSVIEAKWAFRVEVIKAEDVG